MILRTIVPRLISHLPLAFLSCAFVFCAPAGPPPAARPVTLVIAPAASAVPVVVTPEVAEAAEETNEAEPDAEETEPLPLAKPAKQSLTPRMHLVTISPTPKLIWATRVGRTTFRTTMALVGDKIVIGTHGSTLSRANETDDGVYVLDAKTGKQVLMIPTPGVGDRDVGGIAVDHDRVYFTTDNGQVVAATLTGQIVWKAAMSGKVRPAPTLADLDGDGQVDVVAGDEHGNLVAFEGKTGKRLWAHASGANEYHAKGFIGGAAIGDVDGDGKDDVIAGGRDGVMVASRGRDGKQLWTSADSSGIHASPLIGDFDGSGNLEVLAAWSYGEVRLLDLKTGRTRWSQKVEQDQAGIEGLFATPVPLALPKGGVLVTPTAWWGKEDGIVELGPLGRTFRSQEGRVSASAVIMDLDGGNSPEAIVGTEAGQLLSLSLNGARTVLATLKGPIEASAMLADTDGDGKYEILVASNDGLLTCFSTLSPATPYLSRFRGESPQNRGGLKSAKLAGWALAP